MLKQRRLIADQVATSLFAAETAIDAALAKTAGLAGVMPSLRADAGLSALIGQDAVEHTSDAIAALTVARRAIVEAHKGLDLAKHQIGLGAVAFGPEVDKPLSASAAPRERRLQPVARVA